MQTVFIVSMHHSHDKCFDTAMDLHQQPMMMYGSSSTGAFVDLQMCRTKDWSLACHNNHSGLNFQSFELCTLLCLGVGVMGEGVQ